VSLKNILFVCIGNGKIIGDSLGPLIGTVLEKNKRLIQNNVNIEVIGTFENPILYYNVEEFIKNIDSQDYSEIVIIDSALGSKENIGKVMITPAEILIGVGVNRGRMVKGDIILKGVVGINYNNISRNLIELESVEAKQVENIADKMLDIIYSIIFRKTERIG
jgi:putative sporulation protein YyaC